jgi:hypothetical protein
MRLRIGKAILPLFFAWNAGVAASALPADLRLLRMVPAESQVIASMHSPTPGGQPSSLLLITPNNRMDLEDFFAVTGSDPSREMRQVVLVAADGDSLLSEHSLLVSGRFHRDAIFRWAAEGKARKESYRGEAILVVLPLAREKNWFHDVRWLAIVDGEVAIFGTPLSVQRELDREMAQSQPDLFLMERLSRLGRHDESWCLLPAPSPGGVIERVLEKLDPHLGEVAREGGSMQYGIHFGSRIEITASSNASSDSGGRGVSNSANERWGAQRRATNSFLPNSQGDADKDGRSVVVKVSSRQYDAWVRLLSKGDFASADAPTP